MGLGTFIVKSSFLLVISHSYSDMVATDREKEREREKRERERHYRETEIEAPYR